METDRERLLEREKNEETKRKEREGEVVRGEGGGRREKEEERKGEENEGMCVSCLSRLLIMNNIPRNVCVLRNVIFNQF